MLCVLYVAFDAMLLLLVPLLLLWCAVSVDKKRRVWQRAQRNRKRMSATTQKKKKKAAELCVKDEEILFMKFQFHVPFRQFHLTSSSLARSLSVCFMDVLLCRKAVLVTN